MRTIAAISSPPGPGQRGVIRISGPLGRAIARATFRPARGTLELESRAAEWGRFDDGRGSQPALLLWMPAPRSFTREDVVELHLPGSPPLLACALERVLSLGAELAEPGEFTRRAFEHGRLDLTRVEGVLALVHAAGEAQRRAASALLFGGLERRVEELRASLEELRALCEASLDFDERDTGHVGHAELADRARAAIGAVEAALAWEERREPLAGLARVAIVGAPNAGKSSLFNRLTGSRALVSELAGTTREPLRAVWSLAGMPCVLADTAGLAQHAREMRVGSELAPEAAAQDLARAERASADLFLWVIDARREDPAELERERRTLFADGGFAPRIIAWNKVDLPDAAQAPPDSLRAEAWTAVSARTGAGCEELARRVQTALEAVGSPSAASPGPSADSSLSPELSIRHRRALELSRERLQSALASLEACAPLDLVAEDLRSATDALDQIAGRTTPEDLLDRLFARFCLGK